MDGGADGDAVLRGEGEGGDFDMWDATFVNFQMLIFQKKPCESKVRIILTTLVVYDYIFGEAQITRCARSTTLHSNYGKLV